MLSHTRSHVDSNPRTMIYYVHRFQCLDYNSKIIHQTIYYREQDELKKRLIEKDSEEVVSWRCADNLFQNLRFIGGVDISFDKQNRNRSCAILCVLKYPELEVVVYVYVHIQMCETIRIMDMSIVIYKNTFTLP